MAPPVRSKPAARPAPAAKPPQRGLPPVRIRYYRQMKKSRVYNFVASWDSEFQYRGPEQKVSVRLLCGGAQVVPAEVSLDPNDPKDQAFFHVTPLAKGWLRGEKMEVIVNGKKVQEIQLQSKVVSHRWTWLFFFLIFLAPWFVLSVVKTETMNMNLRQDADKAIAKQMPETPDFVKESVPAVHDALVSFRGIVADAAEHIHLLSWTHPLAFYTGVTFFVLMLVSLFLHRDKRRRVTGKPLFLPRPPAAKDEEDEE